MISGRHHIGKVVHLYDNTNDVAIHYFPQMIGHIFHKRRAFEHCASVCDIVEFPVAKIVCDKCHMKKQFLLCETTFWLFKVCGLECQPEKE